MHSQTTATGTARPTEASRSWPGSERRRPPLSTPQFAVREPLARWLEAEAAALAARGVRVRVLDVGCGAKPYYPFFAPVADAYVGLDPVDNPLADVRGSVEDIPLGDGAFDVVLCNQVLEHCDDPARAVAELRRVTAAGGRVLASTHGVQVYHPSPQDLWRWTHSGLRRLFADSAEWASVDVRPGSGSAACVGMLVGHYLDLAAKGAGVRSAARPAIAAVNAAARFADARSARLREPLPGTIFANYHVTAVVPA